MRTYHWNGEYWYERNWSLFHHVRAWFIWFGGWEKANGEGWSVIRRNRAGKLRFRDPTPISLFGHRFTWYGKWWQLRIGRRFLVHGASYPKMLYLSRDGTPSRATTWIFGAPSEVAMAARAKQLNG